MAERRTIGQILMGFGRITEADVERALKHQQDTGGYFGEALLALGLVTQEELEWGLASQFDLPYVFPDADSIDPEAAELVSPEWALAHMTLPIMKTEDSLTVIVDSPIKTDAVDELQRRSGLRIELALASSGKIRELIRQVYSRVGAPEESAESQPAISFEALVGLAVEGGAKRFGISVRGRRATGWYQERGTTLRRTLTGGWTDELESLLQPPPSERTDEGSASWSAHLSHEGFTQPVEVGYLGGSAGVEYLFRPVEEESRSPERFPSPPQGILSEVRLLARSGAARFAVTTDPSELASEILPYLPTLLLEPTWRAAHLHSVGARPEDVFAVEVPDGEDAFAGALSKLRGFQFDAVTADLEGPLEEWIEGVLDLGSAAFVRWDPEADRRMAEKAGIKWEIRIERRSGDRLDWSLHPLK